MSPEPVQTKAAGTSALTRDVTVLNRYGIHARPAALLVKTASRFACEILLEKTGVKVNAKSIMGLLTLEGSRGAVLKVTATGLDAGEALDALEDLVKQKFFED